MKLSIFKNCKALPTKAEKAVQARFTSKPFLPEVIEVVTTDDVIEIICNNAWSPSIFKEFRRQDGFISTDFIVLDIDEEMRIEEAEEVIHMLNICCICIPSTSFTPEDHRYRLIFPLAKTISNKDDFEATMRSVAEHFPAVPACLGDTGRFFFGGKLVDGFYFDSKLLEPIKAPKKLSKTLKVDYSTTERVEVGESLEELVLALYGEVREKIPESIAYFLENAPDNLEGEWYCRGNSFLFTAALTGCEEDAIKDVFFSLYPHEIDSKVEYAIDKILREGYDNRDSEPDYGSHLDIKEK